MEGETRANLNYLEQLYKFHRQAGHPVHKIPQLDKRPIDLFRLKKEVAQRGGYQIVRFFLFPSLLNLPYAEL
jgi:histone demethylase JARID1